MTRLLAAVCLTVALASPACGQDVKPDKRPSVRLVSAIDVKDFGAETLRIGDLDSDGGPDLLFVQSVYGSRQITCLTATDIFGRRLWQTGYFFLFLFFFNH